MLLSIWHILLNQKSKSFFANQFDQTTFYDQTTIMGNSQHLGNTTTDCLPGKFTGYRAPSKLQRKARQMEYYDEEEDSGTSREGDGNDRTNYCEQTGLLAEAESCDESSSSED